MQRALAVVFALAVVASPVCADERPAPAAAGSKDWKDWSALIGDWEADATPDGTSGASSFTLELQGRVLVRKNFASYPKTKERPAVRHDDLSVIYHQGGQTRMDYWDNEGHVIHYAVTVDAGKSYVFLSDATAGVPRFRLTYTLSGPKTLALRFEVAAPNAPEQFKTYIQANLHRSH